MTSKRLAALAIAVALVGARATLADAIPGPQELTAVQSQMVGVWQQSEQAEGRDHAQSRTTFIFDQDKFTRVELHLIAMSNASQSYSESGTWSGAATGADAYELTLTPAGGKPQMLKLTVTGPKAITLQLWPNGPTMAKFERIFP